MLKQISRKIPSEGVKDPHGKCIAIKLTTRDFIPTHLLRACTWTHTVLPEIFTSANCVDIINQGTDKQRCHLHLHIYIV